MSGLNFDGKVAIVTGGALGLGREYCLELARRGAIVVVNDLGASVDGAGGTSSAAEAVVAQIVAAGGQALANAASVTDMGGMDALARQVLDAYGRIDILVANAGILRDKSFGKMPIEDFDAVVGVHLLGTARSVKAVWNTMVAQGKGRIVLTTSASGLFGNFGQSNYGAAKLGIVGLMNGLKIEGQKSDIRVNCISPFAITRMSENLASAEMLKVLRPAKVAQGVVFLASEDAPTGVVLNAGGGAFSTVRLVDSRGLDFGEDGGSAEQVASHWAAISDEAGQRAFFGGSEMAKDFRARPRA